MLCLSISLGLLWFHSSALWSFLQISPTIGFVTFTTKCFLFLTECKCYYNFNFSVYVFAEVIQKRNCYLHTYLMSHKLDELTCEFWKYIFCRYHGIFCVDKHDICKKQFCSFLSDPNNDFIFFSCLISLFKIFMVLKKSSGEWQGSFFQLEEKNI
jgi:hypothetical protein